MNGRRSAIVRRAVARCVVWFVVAISMLGSRGWMSAAHAQAPADPPGTATYRSAHFFVHTDLSEEECKELLTKLETMLELISGYWGRPPRGIIECYVVKDIKLWPAGSIPDDYGRQKIARQEGVTTSLGGRAVVYSCADQGVAQHEAVHAYCFQTFLTAGPTWYAEGMAEMGCYWRKGETDVQVSPALLRYLKQSAPRPMLAIVREPNAGSWQDYAWRWALCHMLSYNTNYRDQFRPLGLSLLTSPKPLTFEQVYGPMADQISFEYEFFLEHFGNGFRADLCSWDWKRKFTVLRGRTGLTSRILAGRGWQPSSCILEEGTEYEYSATGEWQLTKDGESLTAAGDAAGNGRLEAVLLQDFKLGEPFPLGAEGTFVAPAGGQLFLRCRDDWCQLGDNSGTITVKLKPTAP